MLYEVITMITGSIDISVGGVTGLVSMVVAMMLTEHNVSAIWSIPVALGIGLAFGIVQGFLVAYMQIQPFIVTLSGMFFARITSYNVCYTKLLRNIRCSYYCMQFVKLFQVFP